MQVFIFFSVSFCASQLDAEHHWLNDITPEINSTLSALGLELIPLDDDSIPEVWYNFRGVSTTSLRDVIRQYNVNVNSPGSTPPELLSQALRDWAEEHTTRALLAEESLNATNVDATAAEADTQSESVLDTTT